MKNKTTIIIYAVFAVVIVVGLAYLAQPRSNATPTGQVKGQQGGGVLTAEEKSYDFGKISMSAGKVSRVFKIKNTTDKPATINKIYTSCMCTQATLAYNGEKRGPFGMQGHGIGPRVDKQIAPGAEADIEVVFDPAAHGPSGVGQIERAVYIEQEGNLPVELSFSAMVTP